MFSSRVYEEIAPRANNRRHIATSYDSNRTRSRKGRTYDRLNYRSKRDMLARGRSDDHGRGGSRLIGSMYNSRSSCMYSRARMFPRDRGERRRRENKRAERKARGSLYSSASYCLRMRSSRECKSMKSRMGTEIDFKMIREDFMRGWLNSFKFH